MVSRDMFEDLYSWFEAEYAVKNYGLKKSIF